MKKLQNIRLKFTSYSPLQYYSKLDTSSFFKKRTDYFPTERQPTKNAMCGCKGKEDVDECMSCAKKSPCECENKTCKVSLSEIIKKDPTTLKPEEKLLRAIFDTSFDYDK